MRRKTRLSELGPSGRSAGVSLRSPRPQRVRGATFPPSLLPLPRSPGSGPAQVANLLLRGQPYRSDFSWCAKGVLFYFGVKPFLLQAPSQQVAGSPFPCGFSHLLSGGPGSKPWYFGGKEAAKSSVSLTGSINISKHDGTWIQSLGGMSGSPLLGTTIIPLKHARF